MAELTRKPRGARIRVTTLATVTALPWAECASCTWERRQGEGGSWPAVREAARRHAEHTNHVVSTGYRVMHDYGVTATGPARGHCAAHSGYTSICADCARASQ